MNKIYFIKNNKISYLKDKYFAVEHNDEYEIICIESNDNIFYIPIHIAVYCANLGINKNYLPSDLLKDLANFIFRYYKDVDFIKTDDNYTIKRKINSKQIKRAIFQYGYDSNFTYLRLLGIRFKKKHKNLLKISKNTKCLMIAPHPDDEIIGAGGILIKYSNNFDCICMGSSGVSEEGDLALAKKRSEIRINEFNKVMDYIGIKNHWIFETTGTHLRFDNEMIDMLDDYCKVLNLKQYDYIFLPHPKDGHHEHRFITNTLFKLIAKKIGINRSTKIVYYEVWADLKNPNIYFDMQKDGYLFTKYGSAGTNEWNSKLTLPSGKSLLELNYEVLKMYESQFKEDDIFVIQTMKKCILNGKNPIWKFRVCNIEKAL